MLSNEEPKTIRNPPENHLTMFLTTEDLAGLTGRTQAAAQRRWLTRNGYNFEVRSDGRAAVLLEQVRSRQMGSRRERATVPNLRFLDD